MFLKLLTSEVSRPQRYDMLRWGRRQDAYHWRVRDTSVLLYVCLAHRSGYEQPLHVGSMGAASRSGKLPARARQSGTGCMASDTA